MWGRWLASLLLGIAILVLALPITATQQSGSSNVNDLSMEITALETLHDLELTPAQLSALSKLAKESASKGEHREAAKASPAVTNAFKAFQAALSKGDDGPIGDCRQKLDAIMEKEQPELDTDINITDAARSNAAAALALLSVRQLATYVGSQELADPAELLVEGIDQLRTLKDKEREDELTTLADEVTTLISGLDGDDKTREKVVAFLKKAGDIKGDADLAKQKRSLEKAAKQIVGDTTNLDVIGHIAEKGMAELLSNPRLEAAIRIQSRLARAASSETTRTPPRKTGPSAK